MLCTTLIKPAHQDVPMVLILWLLEQFNSTPFPMTLALVGCREEPPGYLAKQTKHREDAAEDTAQLSAVVTTDCWCFPLFCYRMEQKPEDRVGALENISTAFETDQSFLNLKLVFLAETFFILFLKVIAYGKLAVPSRMSLFLTFKLKENHRLSVLRQPTHGE